MYDIVYAKSYEEYKRELLNELSSASESFVRIGYLLKVARDTNILDQTAYHDYLEFAKEEFGLDKTQVSRFIRINDRFSVGGNSTELIEEYKGYGTRKLGIMIQIPEEITEELSSTYTVADIETIKNEVIEEQKITPLEDYIEKVENENNPSTKIANDDILTGTLYEIGKNYPETLKDLFDKDIKEALSPVADQMYIVRIPGVGKLMLICKENEVHIVNARTNEKTIRTWSEVSDAWQQLGSDKQFSSTAEEFYEKLYGEPFPKKEEVAPVQQKKVITKEKPDVKKNKKADNPKTEHKGTPERTVTRTDDNEGIPKNAEPVHPGEEPSEASDDIHDNKPSEDVREDQGDRQGTHEPDSEPDRADGEDNQTIAGEREPESLYEALKFEIREWQQANNLFIASINKNDITEALKELRQISERVDELRFKLIEVKDDEERKSD